MQNLIRTARFLAVLGCAALLASCANLAGPRQVELPLAKLQAGLERRFPLNNRLLELFDVQLTQPQLRLLPESGRIGIDMDAAVAPPFLRQSWRGSLGLSGRLAIDMGRGAIVMAEPRVERFAIDGIDPARQRQLEKAGNVLMQQVAGDLPVYSFKMEDLRFAGIQFTPTRIATTAAALVVTLEPVK